MNQAINRRHLNTPSIAAIRHVAGVAVLASLTSVLLAGCTGRDVPMQPAEDANDPTCAEVIVRLPNTVAELDRRTTNAQSTGAWGDPVAVELRCGIEPAGPTTDTCVNVSGVDWIIDDSAAPLYRFEAYGREPGLEVYVDNELAAGVTVLTDLSGAVSVLPQTRECLTLSDSVPQQ